MGVAHSARYWLGAFVIACACVPAIWAFSRTSVNVPVLPRGVTPANPMEAPEVDGVSPGLMRRVQPRAILTVVARDGGLPARGRISACQYASQAGLLDGLGDGPVGKTADDAGAVHAGLVDGAASLELDESHWTWLRLQTEGHRAYFERIAPFRGEKRIDMTLPRELVIHVQVVDVDWRTPVSNARVRLVEVPISALALGAGREIECDSGGYARIESVEPGRVVLVSRGARPEEGRPCSVALVLHAGQSDARVVLVQPPTRTLLEMDVLADLGDPAGPGPKIFLERMIDQRAPLVPQAGVLADGIQSLRFELPEGAYRVRALPTGALRITGGERIDVAGAGTRVGVTVSRNTETTEVRLRGLSMADFPVRVIAQSADSVRSEDLDNEFYGTFHWHSARQAVPALAGDRVLHVLGRHGCFTSEPVNLTAPSAEVDLQPACRLEVHWTGSVLSQREQPVLVAKGPHQEVVATFVRKMIEGAGVGRPAWVASVVMQHGEVELVAQVGSTEHWRQRVLLQRRHQLVRV